MSKLRLQGHRTAWGHEQRKDGTEGKLGSTDMEDLCARLLAYRRPFSSFTMQDLILRAYNTGFVQGESHGSEVSKEERLAHAAEVAKLLHCHLQSSMDMVEHERARQTAGKGYTPEHDDAHDEGQLAWLAMYYLMPHAVRFACQCGTSCFFTPDSFFEETGFAHRFAKRQGKRRMRQLAVAAALILAEMDRLNRADVCALTKPEARP